MITVVRRILMQNGSRAALDSKYNPLVALGKSGSLGLSGFVNKFNKEGEHASSSLDAASHYVTL